MHVWSKQKKMTILPISMRKSRKLRKKGPCGAYTLKNSPNYRKNCFFFGQGGGNFLVSNATFNLWSSKLKPTFFSRNSWVHSPNHTCLTKTKNTDRFFFWMSHSTNSFEMKFQNDGLWWQSIDDCYVQHIDFQLKIQIAGFKWNANELMSRRIYNSIGGVAKMHNSNNSVNRDNQTAIININ